MGRGHNRETPGSDTGSKTKDQVSYVVVHQRPGEIMGHQVFVSLVVGSIPKHSKTAMIDT